MELPAEIKIDEAYAALPPQFVSRTISAGAIGNPCLAFLELTLRSFPDDPSSSRSQRIFRLGHLLEEQVMKDLRMAGFNIIERDDLTGKQITYLAYGGHVKAKADGNLVHDDNTLSILEIKSMNDASFTKFQKQGLRQAHPKYFAQVMLEMGMSGISEALLIAYNKNTSEYHSETVLFDEFEYQGLMAKAEAVMRGDAPRLATNADDWRCKGCFKRTSCWSSPNIAEPSCRHCKHSKPYHDGTWQCSKLDKPADAVCLHFELFRAKAKA